MIVDCSKTYGNNGCGGGLAVNSFKFVKDNGIVTDKEYPYIAKESPCKIKTGPFKIKDLIEWN